MVYAEFGGQTECIMGNWKIENGGLRAWVSLAVTLQREIRDRSQFTIQ